MNMLGHPVSLITTLVASLLGASAAMAGEWEWDISENSFALGLADQSWTVDTPVYEGSKFLADGHYVIGRSSRETETPGIGREDLKGVLDADLQWGFDESELEVAKLTITPWATQWEYNRETKRRFRVALDQLEWGVVQAGYDDPLGLDKYTEITAVRAGRTWSYKRTDASAFSFYLGAKASVGWAWAESIDPRYEASNPFSGIGMTLGMEHEKLGLLYTDDRIVTGYTLGSPTGETTSREARIRFGYMKKIYKCMTIDVFLDKRSFDFQDSDLPDQYTKAKRFGAEISCKFEQG